MGILPALGPQGQWYKITYIGQILLKATFKTGITWQFKCDECTIGTKVWDCAPLVSIRELWRVADYRVPNLRSLHRHWQGLEIGDGWHPPDLDSGELLLNVLQALALCLWHEEDDEEQAYECHATEHPEGTIRPYRACEVRECLGDNEDARPVEGGGERRGRPSDLGCGSD